MSGRKKVKISKQKGVLGRLHTNLFHPPAAKHRRTMRPGENILFNPIPKYKQRHPRKRKLIIE